MLANPIRGQVGFVAGDKGWTLSFSVNALAALEIVLGKPVADITKMLNSPDIRIVDLRTIFCAGLQDHQPGTESEAAGDLIGAVGIRKAADLIGATFLAAFPAVEDAKASDRPPKGVGTGSRSSARGAKSASTPEATGASPHA